jgi:membrane-associated protein
MTEWLLALVPTWGPWLLALTTFGSCLMLPLPASMLVLAAGGFIAAGDLALAPTAGGVMAGLMAGNQTGYRLGRAGGARLIARLAARVPAVTKATDLLARRGGLAVFLSRWLLSPLGPYVTVAAGAARLRWATFTLWDALGGAIWVGLYLGLGFTFAGNLAAATALAGNAVGLVAALAATAGLIWWLVHTIRAERGR